MKNLIIKIMFALLCLVTTNVNAQLPLQYGDAVVTHSPSVQNNGTLIPDGVIVRTIKSSNTSLAPLGSNWTVDTEPGGTKPENFSSPNWTYDILDPVFGITLDTRPNPNIYVSNTQIYYGTDNNFSKIWRLDGTSGAHTLVYDFNNNNRSLGNLKYKQIGGVENIYVSNFENGALERLSGNSTATNSWARNSSFVPKFGKLSSDPNIVPYGIAIRNMNNNTFKLYYAKTSITGNYNTNEIWSVALNSIGDFIANTEEQENIITSALADYSKTVISDIAFTENGNSMLLGQQTWMSGMKIRAHNSNVVELNYNEVDNQWVNSVNLFPASRNYPSSNDAYSAVGGVSYSDNIFNGNSTQFACDTTVAMSVDYLSLSRTGISVYGMQFMKRAPLNNLQNSIWIDQDDRILNYANDKWNLGDIEVYKNPQVCKKECECGAWEGMAFNSDTSWWNNTNGTMPSVPVISFNQGEAKGVLFPNYNCNGSCNVTFPYTEIIDANGKVLTKARNSRDNFPLENLGMNKLPCGSYTVSIIPECEGKECTPLDIPIVIVCPPQCLDCGGNAEVSRKDIQYEKDMLHTTFSISNDNPVTEVRVLVEEFRVISENGNENCFLCKNTPKTWGSIQSASLAGINYRGSSSSIIDNREAVFNNNEFIDLNNANQLLLSLAMPQTTDLDCCNLKAEICLKVIIRDNFCCEQEVLKCFTVNIK